MIKAVLSYGALAAAYLWAFWHWAMDYAEKQHEKRRADKLKKEAQDHADTPLTGDDFKRRMRERISRKD